MYQSNSGNKSRNIMINSAPIMHSDRHCQMKIFCNYLILYEANDVKLTGPSTHIALLVWLEVFYSMHVICVHVDPLAAAQSFADLKSQFQLVCGYSCCGCHSGAVVLQHKPVEWLYRYYFSDGCHGIPIVMSPTVLIDFIGCSSPVNKWNCCKSGRCIITKSSGLYRMTPMQESLTRRNDRHRPHF